VAAGSYGQHGALLSSVCGSQDTEAEEQPALWRLILIHDRVDNTRNTYSFRRPFMNTVATMQTHSSSRPKAIAHPMMIDTETHAISHSSK